MRISTSSGLIFCAISVLFLFTGCAGHDQHAMHKQMLQTPTVTTGSIRMFHTPDVTLINQERMPVKLTEALNDERPVLLQFVYATCTTICPVLSAGFSSLQEKLSEEAVETRFISITIDPEHDNPEILKRYLAKYDAQPGWDFLTGSKKDIDQVMRAFDSYVSNKMSHKPLTFIKVPGESKWLRLNGLMGTQELYNEFRRIHPK
jgi:protein SCO1/2